MDIPVKALSDIEVKSEVSENDKILILDSETEEARLASKDELKGKQGDPGEQGEPGEPGQDGVAATITIGSTQTLPAGSSATVTNTGSSSEAVLDFGIPTGPEGAPGQDGNDGRGIYSITTSKSGKTTTITITYTDGSTPSTFQVEDGADGQGSGDVVGPSSSTSGHLVVFDGPTGKIIKDGGAIPNGVIVSSTAPSSATEGMVWYDTANDILKCYDGTNWNGVGAVVSVNGNTGVVTVSEFTPSGTPAVGDVVTKTANGYERATPSGGDVGISTQANNILTSGTKLWCGTQANYENLSTYDNNTIYLTI